MGSVVSAKTLETDVVVVGAGGGGLSAAIEAADAGASVILLEKMAFAGGSTVVSGGIVHAADTVVQAEAGITDSAEDMYQYRMVFANAQVDAALVKLASQKSADAIDFLIANGVEFLPERLYIAGSEPLPRGHRATDGGGGLVRGLTDSVDANPNITLMLETPATDLIHENGRVVGVTAQDKEGEELEIRAKAVVLATGGFGNSMEMLRRHQPHLAALGDSYYWAGTPGATGDGIIMAQKLGAQTVKMESEGGSLVASAVDEVPARNWMIYVNQQGQRFVNEAAFYSFIISQFNQQPQRLAWAVFDSAMLEELDIDEDVVTELVSDGKLAAGGSVEELAAELGIANPQTLVNTIQRHNTDAANGEDTIFDKDPSLLRPLTEGPFYGVQILNRRSLLTIGGLRINTNAEVLTTTGEVIPGLMAAGETVGGLIGEYYPGSGTAIVDAIVFGRIAGQNAAAAK